MPNPRVTVIIPTYNWSSVLPYSIHSALKQTFADLELLVIGDACTDDSEKAVKDIQDPRVRWINLAKNSGSSIVPTNEGLQQSRGSIIAYLGHDDLWLPKHLEYLTQAIDSGADITYGLLLMIHPNGRPTINYYNCKPGDYITPTAVAHRREVTELVGNWSVFSRNKNWSESQLFKRAYAAGFSCKPVKRLTAIKFPAGERRNVYRLRPNHEQAEWTQRLETWPDAETSLCEFLLQEAYAPKLKPFRKLCAEFYSEVALRAKNRLLHPLKENLDVQLEKLRRHKGIPPHLPPSTFNKTSS